MAALPACQAVIATVIEYAYQYCTPKILAAPICVVRSHAWSTGLAVDSFQCKVQTAAAVGVE